MKSYYTAVFPWRLILSHNQEAFVSFFFPNLLFRTSEIPDGNFSQFHYWQHAKNIESREKERETETAADRGRNREMLNIAGDQKDAIQDHDGTPFFNRLDGNN